MDYWYIAASLLVLCFSGVILFGAPYLPTLSRQRKVALELLDLKKGQILLEPGSGDGRVLAEAAQKGISCIGVELNPILVLASLVITWKYRKNVKIIWGNFWRKDWSEADGIFLFLMDRHIGKFDEKMKTLPKKRRLVASFAYKIPNKRMLQEKDGVFLYEYK
jgi:16S rRNA A1518/A1519 N6-dimethyltransferase RsmA/KsgA/DIM1 with predicted DNA glycosylase/AP lyase activity